MNVSTLNARIKSLMSHGFSLEDVKSMTDKVEGFLWSSDTTKAGRISSSISPEVFSRLKSSIKTWRQISKESKETLGKDYIKATDEAIIKEYHAKQELDDYLDEMNAKYYDLIKSISGKYGIAMDDVESMLTNIKSGRSLVTGFTKWGELWNKNELSYTKATARLHTINRLLDDVEKDFDKFMKENKGVMPW